ncbi:hypothetical protein GCM10010470_21340 [Saccharopolyspora taberi]|uniref:non-specific serine/threonine protein kinase n=1 Tax=Saccharopolyspora taberi TaxID=60895 RepID=A0ABN3VAK6_9PSEU
MSELLAGKGRRIRKWRHWLHVDHPGAVLPEHGWKLHVAARPSTLATTLRLVLPLLLETGCAFKVISDQSALAVLNSTENPDPGSVGKAVTVYPDQTPEGIVALAHRLVRALSGMDAPVVLSDRRVSRDAPVYYRYGPFAPRYRTGGDGRHELVMYGPDGAEFPGEAGPAYSCPPWARDPFTSATALLGGRFRIRGGVQRTAGGAVYRADDVRGGRSVIVKQAHPWVGEDSRGADVRAPLRNERRILTVLEGLDCVPELVDHFRHGQDEFLARTDLGGRTLGEDIAEHGLYVDPCDSGADLVPRTDGRTLRRLAADLVTLLDRVHERGVVLRDLAPKNIVVDGDRLGLIDFAISAHEGVQCSGYTPGYAPPRQRENPPARVEDDYYALGATLFHAATGLSPVVADRAPCTARTLDCLVGVFPCLADGSARGAITAIPDLLSCDADRQRRAVAALRRGTAVEVVAAPAPRGTNELQLENQLLQRLHDYAFAVDDDRPPAPICVQAGATGIILELLHHNDDTSRAARACLLKRVRRTLERVELPAPGLMFGATGTAVALALLSRSGDGTNELVARLAPPDPGLLPPDPRDDHTHGLAGIGAGHLLLASLLGDERHLDVADACARRLVAGDCARTADTAEPDRPGTGASVARGFAHGTAGFVSFLLDHRVALGPQRHLDEALARWCRTLVDHTRRVIAATRTPQIRPMAGSSCQGLAGLGTTLVKAARVLAEPGYLDLATEAGHAATRLATRMGGTDQCCGLAGLGDFLLDLAAADPAWHDEARRVAAILLTRLPGLARDPDPADRDRCWGTGDAGVLGFLRRLRTQGPRTWPPALNRSGGWGG